MFSRLFRKQQDSHLASLQCCSNKPVRFYKPSFIAIDQLLHLMQAADFINSDATILREKDSTCGKTVVTKIGST